MRILFVTRKYPPSTGGMENMAYELSKALAAHNDVTLVKWGGTNKLLPVVYPWLLLRSLWHGMLHRPDVIYLPDGLMGPLGWVLKVLLHRPTVITVHGLEATYTNPLYRAIVTPFITRQTRMTTGSHDAKERIQKELPGTDPVVIFHGLRDSYYEARPRKELLAVIAKETDISIEQLQSSKLLHTNGRLVRRKGVLWFVQNVMPKLVSDESVLYLVSGTGKDQELIEAAIAKHGLENQVKLLGRVSDELLRALYNAADIFVMPNVKVANDMEGFGLVALEAASCGTAVVASRLEGIQDAIIDGQNGLLLEPGNAAEYHKTISHEFGKRSLQPEAVRSYTLSHYSWTEAAAQYEALMREVIS